MHVQLLWIVSPIGHDALEDRMIEEIRSRSNQWIKKALQLKQRKYRQAYGMFLMEGLRSVEDALRQGMKACTCFFTENQLETARRFPIQPKLQGRSPHGGVRWGGEYIRMALALLGGVC